MNYDELSVAQLREIAKEKNILKVSSMKKQELIEAISALEKPASKPSAEKTEATTEKKSVKKTETAGKKQPAKKEEPVAEEQPAKKEEPVAEEQPAKKAEKKPAKKAEPAAEEQPAKKAEEKPVKKTETAGKKQPAKKAEPAAKEQPTEEKPVKKTETAGKKQPAKKAEPAAEEKPTKKAEPAAEEQPAKKAEEKPVKKTETAEGKKAGQKKNISEEEKTVSKQTEPQNASEINPVNEADEQEAKKKAAAEIIAAAEVREAAQKIEQNAQKLFQSNAQNSSAGLNGQNNQNNQNGQNRQNVQQRNGIGGNQGGQNGQRFSQGGVQRSYQSGGKQNYQQGGSQNRDSQSVNGYSQNRYSQQRDNFQQSADNTSGNNGYQYKDPGVEANESMKNAQQQEASRRPMIPDVDYDARSIMTPEIEQLDSGVTKEGILEIMNDGYGFIRCDNFLPGEHDVYVSPAQIRKLNLKTGDIISGNTKIKGPAEKFSALLYVKTVNGRHPSEAHRRPKFEDLTPIFPHERIHLETPGCTPAMRIVDMLSPIGKGQRGMIVSQPKAGKTTLLKQIAKAITTNYPDMHLIILLIDERPEEVTDMKESIEGNNVEVIYSTFDELPENHKRVSEMVIERAKRLVEHKMDVCVLLDSITRLARAYNLTCTASGRTLSGGLDPAALHMPKKFFGAARCMREGGSLTILATALVDTGSRMDDVVFEEFKGTGNMELVLDRNLSEKRIFPAIDLPRSSTRRDDLLLSPQEQEVNDILRHAFNSARSDQMLEKIINLFTNTKTNREFCETVKKTKLN